ncbi:MAG: glycosyltransferase family 4 protein [Ruminococcaceae bacterium]|nr:glycosyltransferase family 4 protein [Oscillospiraceae bacterium]
MEETLNKGLKIAMVAPVPPPYGGIGNWVLMLDNYVKNDDSVEFVHINTAPVSRGLDGRSLWDRVVTQGLMMLKKRKELLKAIKEQKLDAVHITTSGQLAIIRDILMLKACKKKNVRSIYHIRFGRIPEIAKANTTEWKLMRVALKLADCVIAIDTTTQKAIQEFLPYVNVCNIPNPFNLDTVSLENISQNKEIVYIGWVIKTKGMEELLPAFEKVSKKNPDWCLRIVGPYSEEYKKHLEDNFSTSKVIFEGEKSHDEAMELLKGAGIFILPSHTEGFPNVVLEAMAHKKPIIATDVGAIPDIIKDCGILIRNKNQEDIEKALEKLINDKELRESLGQEARKKLEESYSLDIVMQRYREEWSK